MPQTTKMKPWMLLLAPVIIILISFILYILFYNKTVDYSDIAQSLIEDANSRLGNKFNTYGAQPIVTDFTDKDEFVHVYVTPSSGIELWIKLTKKGEFVAAFSSVLARISTNKMEETLYNMNLVTAIADNSLSFEDSNGILIDLDIYKVFFNPRYKKSIVVNEKNHLLYSEDGYIQLQSQ